MNKQGMATKERLITAVETLIESHDSLDIKVSDISKATGITVGSIYHHFSDLSDLLEEGVLRRFRRYVDANTFAISQIVENATSREECALMLKAVTRTATSPKGTTDRLIRARAIDLAGRQPRFKRKLVEVQEELTEALTRLVISTQERNWIRSDFDPRSIAVFIQAYSFGRIVDDINDIKMDNESWYKIIDELLDRVFLT